MREAKSTKRFVAFDSPNDEAAHRPTHNPIATASTLAEMAYNPIAIASNLIGMASNLIDLIAMVSNLIDLIAMVSNLIDLIAMVSNLIATASQKDRSQRRPIALAPQGHFAL